MGLQSAYWVCGRLVAMVDLYFFGVHSYKSHTQNLNFILYDQLDMRWYVKLLDLTQLLLG